MQRKFLEDLGLEKEAIDKIMAENGNDIEAEKKKIGAVEAERDDYKQKFETADQSLDELKKKDIDGIEKELTEYKEKYEKLEKSISKEIMKVPLSPICPVIISPQNWLKRQYWLK